MTTGPDIFSQEDGVRIPVKQIEPQFDSAMVTSEHEGHGVRRGRPRLGTTLFAHEDPLGNDGQLEPGGAQVMRFSSRGALHSERNGSKTEGLRFLQFWILPSQEGLENSVQQRQYTEADRRGRMLQIMGPAGEDGLDLAQRLAFLSPGSAGVTARAE